MHIFGEISFIKPQNDALQINGQKRRKMKEKDLSCLGLIFTACSVLGRLLASIIKMNEDGIWQDILFLCTGMWHVIIVKVLFVCYSCTGKMSDVVH